MIPIPYAPTNWKDRAVERPRTYQLQDNGDGTYTLIPAPGTVYEPGTPVIAVNMNKIEQGIANATDIAEAALPKSGGTTTGDIVIDKITPRIIFRDKGTGNSINGLLFQDASGSNEFVFGFNPNNDALAIYDYKTAKTKIALRSDDSIDFYGTELRFNTNRVWDRGQLRWNSNGYLEYNDGGTWRPVAGVKRVQRGIAQVTASTSTSATVNVTISSVNMNKSFVNVSSTGHGNTNDGVATATVRARLTSSTNLELYYTPPQLNGTALVSWEVIEFY